MSKKIKIFLMLAIMSFILLISNKALAFPGEFNLYGHVNVDGSWHPTYYDGGYLYCKDKGGKMDIPYQIKDNLVLYNKIKTDKTEIEDDISKIMTPINAAEEKSKWHTLYGNVMANPTTSYSKTNDSIAYIASSGTNTTVEEYASVVEPAYQTKQGNHIHAVAETATAEEKQQALWNDPDYNEGTILSGSTLYAEAQEYEKYYNDTFSDKKTYKDNVSLNSTEAQIIALQDTQEYILGPYTITYPDHPEFSYIDDMYLEYTTTDGTTKKYSLSDSEVIKEINSTSIYPHSTQQNGTQYTNHFYIKVKADKIGYSKVVNFGAHFTYITTTSASYERYKVTASALTYYKTIVPYSWDKDGNVTSWEGTAWSAGQQEPEWQPISYISDNDCSRTYGNTDITLQANIDLTMKLGGNVWRDAKQGKESKEDGLYNTSSTDEDKAIPNVKVRIYQKGNTTAIDETKTDKNGYFEFVNLNSMYKYYVEYVYNGQYYQPTTYYVGTTTNWNGNSKGMDISTQRDAYNNGFEEIGASSHNYYSQSLKAYNKTFSLKYLQGYRLEYNSTSKKYEYKLEATPVVDEFGNLLVNYDSTGKLKKWDYSSKTRQDTNWNTSEDVSLSNVTSEEMKQMIQYVLDSQMSSFTCNGSSSMICYPLNDEFVIDTKQNDIRVPKGVSKVNILYDSNYHINQGLTARETADLAIRKDVYKATLSINGKTQTYMYNKRVGYQKDSNGNDYFEVDTRASDVNYYSTTYTRQVYPEDYYAVTNPNVSQALNIEVTYKVTVRNQSGSINTNLTELVDYYDTDYTFKEAHIGTSSSDDNKQALTSNTNSSTISMNNGTEKNLGNGYNHVYINGNNTQIQNNSDIYIYVTFVVNKDATSKVLLDDKDAGKQNIVEINGYKTYYSEKAIAPNINNSNASGVEYKSGDVSGLVDVDSNPGNVDSSMMKTDGTPNYAKFEDDTDKAPNIKILLYNDPRTLSGTTWEDTRNKEVEKAVIGNGIRDNEENLIEGIKVQLWDNDKNSIAKIWNGNSWNDAITTTGEDGTYLFNGYTPGNYIVQFIYGDKTYNVTQYNAQDYKSTIYNSPSGFDVTKPDEKYSYDLLQADKDNTSSSYKSDARDLNSIRTTVDNYCNNNGNGVTNVLAQELKDASTKKDTNLSPMTANSALIDAEVEYGRKVSELAGTNSDTAIGSGYQNTQNNTGNYQTAGKYNIQNLDFGLTERPKSQLELLKQVANVKVTLADGSTLFDATQKATNVMWLNTSEIAYKGYKNNNEMTKPEVRTNATNKGKIQLTMDSELMHGATIKITYAIFIANTGEVNYKDNEFYYLGNEENPTDNIVKTRANKVIDYVGYNGSTDDKATRNNLKFNSDDNKDNGWSVLSQEDLATLNSDVQTKSKLYNTVITNNKLNAELIPIIADTDSNAKNAIIDATKGSYDKVQTYATKNSITATTLVLSQTLSSENKSDDMTYNNMAEIINTNNTVGRRMAYSVAGDQDPTLEPAEVDADDAQEIVILPPFGQNHNIYYIIGASVAIIIVAGIFIIKKKVLKK